MSIEGPKNERTHTDASESIDQQHARVFEWREHGFNLHDELKHRRGPYIEVAGPTLEGYEQVSQDDFEDVYKRLHTSNVTDGLYELQRDIHTDEFEFKKVAPVHFVADAKQLPLGDNAVGALFCAYLNVDQRDAFLAEASRSLEEGGLLIMQGCRIEDFRVAQSVGLSLVSYSWQLPQSVIKEIPADVDGMDLTVMIELVNELMEKHAGSGYRYLRVGDEFPEEELGDEAGFDKAGRRIYWEDDLFPQAAIFRKE